jgi:enamine deaminase RidA (YjgF/YER057c/UK114 family)
VTSALEKEKIHKKFAMEPVVPAGSAILGPYTPAIKANGMVFCSGQIGLVEGTLAEGVKAQAEASLNACKVVLEAAGGLSTCAVFTLRFFPSQSSEGHRVSYRHG